MIRKSGEETAPCQAIDPSAAPLTGEVNENWNYSLNQPSALIYEQVGLSAGSTYEIAVFACNSEGASEPAILTHSFPAPPQQGGYVYPGPILTKFTPSTAATGEVVVIRGDRLNLIDAIQIGGIPAEFVIDNATTVRIKVPYGLEDGVYDVVVNSSFGRLTVQGALTVMGAPVNEDLNPAEPEQGENLDQDEGKSPDEVDTDRDGQNNDVDTDVDGDGIPNGLDNDLDGDGINNGKDPNPVIPNAPEDELQDDRPINGDKPVENEESEDSPIPGIDGDSPILPKNQPTLPFSAILILLALGGFLAWRQARTKAAVGQD